MSKQNVGGIVALVLGALGLLAVLLVPKVEVPGRAKTAVVAQTECTETVSVTKKLAADGATETTVKTKNVPCELEELSFGTKVGLTALRILMF